jgi:hypothetical protein
MIVKIKHEGDWVIFGEIDKFSGLGFSFDNTGTTSEVYGTKLCSADKGRLFRILQRNGQERIIVSFQQAYLLNDEGKTIERIN